MQSLICTTPGQFEYKNTADPVPAEGNTVIAIKRVGICGTDLHAFEGTQPYFTYPRVLGHELAGEIVETSANNFRKGDWVTIIPYFYCGHCVACRAGRTNCCVSLKVCGVHVDGGMVNYFSAPDYSLMHAGRLDPDALALVEPFAIGAHAVKRAAIKENDYVLLAGAGPIGLGISAFAKLAGAKVIVMDINAGRLQFCRGHQGIEYTVNAAEDDIMHQLKTITHDDMPNIVIDATGSQKVINDLFQYMAHGGRYVLVGLQKEFISFSHPEFHKREATLMSSRNATREDFETVMRAFNNKQIDPQAYITHRFAFDKVKNEFSKLLDKKEKVIKAMIEF